MRNKEKRRSDQGEWKRGRECGLRKGNWGDRGLQIDRRNGNRKKDGYALRSYL
jgi:hypothetical protein